MMPLDTTQLADLLRQSLAQGQHPLLTITSNSMLPLLRRGDQVRLEAVTLAQLQPGDIITTVQPTYLLTHRFWGGNTDTGSLRLYTRGDRSWQFDPPADSANLLGRVQGRCRGVRCLSLQTGRGQQLNRQLTRLAAWEWRWLTHAPAKTILPQGETAVSLNYTQRIGRRLLLIATQTLTNILSY